MDPIGTPKTIFADLDNFLNDFFDETFFIRFFIEKGTLQTFKNYDYSQEGHQNPENPHTSKNGQKWTRFGSLLVTLGLTFSTFSRFATVLDTFVSPSFLCDFWVAKKRENDEKVSESRL